MITAYKNEPENISAAQYSPDVLTLAVFNEKDFRENGEALGLYPDCINLKPSEMRYEESEILFSIEKISTDINNRADKKTSVFIRQNLFAVIEPDSETEENFIKTVNAHKNPVTLEKLIYDFLLSLTHNDSRELDEIELLISELEDAVLTDGKTDDLNNELLKIKRKLLKLRVFYEQLSDISDILLKNENKLLSDKKLKLFRDYGRGTDKLISKIDMLRESLVQLREAYQASIDLKLNNTMKIFTVIATVFLPLTLITSWYGMNFKYMPELGWKYGYLFVIILSILVAVFCIVLFKKKKLM